MVALDGHHHPINLWIHKGCHDPTKIEEILKDVEWKKRFLSMG